MLDVFRVYFSAQPEDHQKLQNGKDRHGHHGFPIKTFLISGKGHDLQKQRRQKFSRCGHHIKYCQNTGQISIRLVHIRQNVSRKKYAEQKQAKKMQALLFRFSHTE